MATRTRVIGLSGYLKDKRIAAGITQRQASLILGHSTSQYISNFERGVCKPSVEMAEKLCPAYKIPKKELYGILVSLYKSELKMQFRKNGVRI